MITALSHWLPSSGEEGASGRNSLCYPYAKKCLFYQCRIIHKVHWQEKTPLVQWVQLNLAWLWSSGEFLLSASECLIFCLGWSCELLGIKVKECSNNNNNNKLTIINIAVPAAQNILTTEEEKVERYQDLALEIKRNPRATRVIACVQTSPISFSVCTQNKGKRRRVKQRK